MYNQRQKEQLVLLIDSGKNTYADIKHAIPELTDDELRIAALPMLINNLSERILDMNHRPSDELDCYQFSDTDVFSLNQYGEDLLLKVQKERHLEFLTTISVIASIIAAICSLISIIRC